MDEYSLEKSGKSGLFNNYIKNFECYVGTIELLVGQQKMTRLGMILALVYVLSFVGCATPDGSSKPLGWRASEVDNLKIALISDPYVEEIYFWANGFVGMTLGKRDEYLTAPLFKWNIDEDGVLIVANGNGQIYQAMKKISLDDRKLVVEVDGKRQVYERLK